MSIKLSDSIRVGQQKPLEDKYFNELVPYTSTTQVNTLIPKGVRHIGLTVNINKEEYWYKDGIEDSNLVLKITNNDIYDLKNQEQDDRLESIEGENASQNDLINDLFSEFDFSKEETSSEKNSESLKGARMGDEFSELDSLNEKDLLEALSYSVGEKNSISEYKPMVSESKNETLSIDSSNVNDLSLLISKLLNNKTLEITIKIKD